MKSAAVSQKWIVCRVCLKRPMEDEMENIFDKNEEKDLTQMILECGGVPIKRFDYYPDKICTKCLKYLRVAYKFRITCQRSHKHLSQLILPVVVEKTEDESITQNITMSSSIPDIQLELDEAEDISLKLEPDVKIGIKQEFIDIDDDVVDVFEPMEDDGEVFDELDRFDAENTETEKAPGNSTISSEDAEFLDDFIVNILTSDEEFLPLNTRLNKKKNKMKRSPNKSYCSKASTSKPDVINKESGDNTGSGTSKKRGPKPKIKEASFICDVCGNIYSTQGRLTEHIKLHKGIKPHECEICGHAFAQTQQLARHMNTHTGNRPYKCSYCPAAFADLSTRNKHHRIHTNERPYVCDVCGKAFTYTNTLKFHKMIHTGEKPFVCDICGKGFLQAYKLRNHKMTHMKKMVKQEKIEVEQLSLESYQEVNAAAAHLLEM